MMQIFKLLAAGLASVLIAASSQANPEIYDFDWRDKRYHSKQTGQIEELSREHFGSGLTHTKQDLKTLQRLIHKGAINRNNTEQLQALGAVLGNVMTEDFGLVWKIYEDNLGRSRALCTETEEHSECLFPITMLSRRIEVGIVPDVQEVYKKAYEAIKPHLQKLPYEVN
ncbi:MAG: hypothetical protein AseanaTS_24430 [Candidatus Pelagadaptatus aseana]|uniref:DUF3806 domain-containing protein n=1 Tax=Candidatus Pelagadaptatus aseana TaxID=3120508 RepID=UPI0039B2AEB8